MKRYLELFIILSIFIVPLSSLVPVPGTIVWYPQFLAFTIIGFTILSLMLWEFSQPISILSLYCIFSYIFVCHQHPRSLVCMIGVYLASFLAKIVSEQKRLTIYAAIALMAILQFGFVIVQILNKDPFFHQVYSSHSDVVGFLGSHNQLGIYYAAVAPILISICPPLVLCSILPIIWSKCASALIGLIFGIGVYGFYNQIINQKILVAGFLVLILGIFLWIKFDNTCLGAFGERLKIWRLTIQQSIDGKAYSKNPNKEIVCNPLFGFGIGSFMIASPKTQWKVLGPEIHHQYEHPHNDLIEIFFELGRVGLAIVLWLVVSTVFVFLRCANKTTKLVMTFSSLVAQGICSLGVYVINAPVSFFMLAITFGLFMGELNNAKQS